MRRLCPANSNNLRAGRCVIYQKTDTDIIAQDEQASHALDMLSEVARAIAQATEIAETVQLRDKASALRYLTSQLGLDRDIQNNAALACIAAERKNPDYLSSVKLGNFEATNDVEKACRKKDLIILIFKTNEEPERDIYWE